MDILKKYEKLKKQDNAHNKQSNLSKDDASMSEFEVMDSVKLPLWDGAKNLKNTVVGELTVHTTDRANADHKAASFIAGLPGMSWITAKINPSVMLNEKIKSSLTPKSIQNLEDSRETTLEFKPTAHDNLRNVPGNIIESPRHTPGQSIQTFQLKGLQLVDLFKYTSKRQNRTYDLINYNGTTFVKHAAKAAGHTVKDNAFQNNQNFTKDLSKYYQYSQALDKFKNGFADQISRTMAFNAINIADNLSGLNSHLQNLYSILRTNPRKIKDWKSNEFKDITAELSPSGLFAKSFKYEKMFMANRYYLNHVQNEMTSRLPENWNGKDTNVFENIYFGDLNNKLPISIRVPRPAMDETISTTADPQIKLMSSYLGRTVDTYNNLCSSIYYYAINSARQNAPSPVVIAIANDIYKATQNKAIPTDITKNCILPFSTSGSGQEDVKGMNYVHEATKSSNPFISNQRRSHEAAYWYSADKTEKCKFDGKHECKIPMNQQGQYSEFNTWIRSDKDRAIIRNSWITKKDTGNAGEREANIDARIANYNKRSQELSNDINQNILPCDMIFVRGVKDYSFLEKTYKNKENLDKSFVSTTLKESTATKFKGNKGAYVIIKAPKGTPVLDMRYISFFNSETNTEEEMLFNCNAPIKIVARGKNKQYGVFYYCEYTK